MPYTPMDPMDCQIDDYLSIQLARKRRLVRHHLLIQTTCGAAMAIT
jgi:hypothetical protein